MSKHWFIAKLIEKYTKNKKLGLDIGIGQDNWKEFKKSNFIGIDKTQDSKSDIMLNLEGKLPFKDNVFDVVIAINSLNYVENARRLLNEINRVMKKGSPIVCVVDNEKSKNGQYVWEQRYLDRILEVTGFQSVLSKSLKDFLYAKWYNKTSVYAFAVVKKPIKIINKKPQICTKCGNTLYEKAVKDLETGKYIHKKCPKQISKKAKSYSIFTTHPDS